MKFLNHILKVDLLNDVIFYLTHITPIHILNTRFLRCRTTDHCYKLVGDDLPCDTYKEIRLPVWE